MGQTFHNGGLTRTWFTYQDGVVFGSTGEYLQHTPNLLVPANDRVKFTCSCLVNQVAGKLLQECVLVVLCHNFFSFLFSKSVSG